jgi:hypothetical protein
VHIRMKLMLVFCASANGMKLAVVSRFGEGQARRKVHRAKENYDSRLASSLAIIMVQIRYPSTLYHDIVQCFCNEYVFLFLLRTLKSCMH